MKVSWILLIIAGVLILTFITILIVILVNTIASVQNPKRFPKPIPYIKVNDFLGKWYEIASNPFIFQSQCVKNTTAEYSLIEDANDVDGYYIQVKNSCCRNLDTCDIDIQIGKAILPQPTSFQETTSLDTTIEPAYVKVGFSGFYGDYFVVAADETNWSWIAVASASESDINKKADGLLWILSRNSQMSNSKYNEIKVLLESKNINTSKLRKTVQD